MFDAAQPALPLTRALQELEPPAADIHGPYKNNTRIFLRARSKAAPSCSHNIKPTYAAEP